MATVEHQPVEKCLHRVPISYMLWRTDSQQVAQLLLIRRYTQNTPRMKLPCLEILNNYNKFYTCTYVYNCSISPMAVKLTDQQRLVWRTDTSCMQSLIFALLPLILHFLLRQIAIFAIAIFVQVVVVDFVPPSHQKRSWTRETNCCWFSGAWRVVPRVVQ